MCARVCIYSQIHAHIPTCTHIYMPTCRTFVCVLETCKSNYVLTIPPREGVGGGGFNVIGC